MKADEKKKSSEKTEAKASTNEAEFHPMENIYRFFDEFFPGPWINHPRFMRGNFPGSELFGAEQPQVDIVDGEKEILVTANLPGVNKEDIDVSITENSLTIRARKKEEHEETKGEYFRREISRGEISRTLPLPAEVNSQEASAVYSDGVLKLKLPKVRSSKRHSLKIE